MYLHKAGTVALELGQYEKARDYFVRVRDEFPASSEAFNVNAFIGRAEEAMN